MRALATLFSTFLLAACASPPRPSLARALSDAAGRAMRVDRDGDHLVGYAADTPLPEGDQTLGEQRARALFRAASVALAIDDEELGPLEWAWHPAPTACVMQLWPRTHEKTQRGLCVAFDLQFRPRWIDVGWSAAIAARRDVLRPSREILEELRAKEPDAIWESSPRLELDAARPVYRWQSTSGSSLDTTTVDATTGAVLGVHRVPL